MDQAPQGEKATLTPEITIRFWSVTKYKKVRTHYMVAVIGGNYAVHETRDPYGDVAEIRFIPKRRKRYNDLPRMRSVQSE